MRTAKNGIAIAITLTLAACGDHAGVASPADASPSAARSEGPGTPRVQLDMYGLTIGMTPEEAKAKFPTLECQIEGGDGHCDTPVEGKGELRVRFASGALVHAKVTGAFVPTLKALETKWGSPYPMEDYSSGGLIWLWLGAEGAHLMRREAVFETSLTLATPDEMAIWRERDLKEIRAALQVALVTDGQGVSFAGARPGMSIEDLPKGCVRARAGFDWKCSIEVKSPADHGWAVVTAVDGQVTRVEFSSSALMVGNWSRVGVAHAVGAELKSRGVEHNIMSRAIVVPKGERVQIEYSEEEVALVLTRYETPLPEL